MCNYYFNVNTHDKSIFVLDFDISFLFIKTIRHLYKIEHVMTDCHRQILRIGYRDERFSLFQQLCCTYPLLNELYKQFFNVHATLQTHLAFCITIRQPPIIHLGTHRDARREKSGKTANSVYIVPH